ncbi:MAG: hypothetical protein AAGA78_09890, partial [Pseudomonadota bacterium]
MTTAQRILVSGLVVLCVVFGLSAQAQEAAPLDPSASLLEILKDEVARDALIATLEARAAQSASPDGEPEVVADPSLGRQIAEVTTGLAQSIADQATELWQGVSTAPLALMSLAQVNADLIIEVVIDLVFVILATTLVYALLRRLTRDPLRSLAVSAEHRRWAVRLVLAILAAIAGLVVVLLAWAAGYILTTVFSDGFGVLEVRQSLYLNAFLVVNVLRVAVRSVLAPDSPSLRLFALPSTAVRRLWRFLSGSIFLVGYGYLLVVPIVNSAAGRAAGNAVGMAIALLVVLAAIRLVLRHRRAVARWLHTNEESE